MAGGTLASLVVAVGLDDRALMSGISRMNKNVLSSFANMGKAANSELASSAAGIERQGASIGSAIAKPMLMGVTAVVAVGASLAALAIQFESETSHIAASAGITGEAAQEVGKDFLKAVGSSQQMIFSAKDMTESYAAVAGQLALTDSKANVVSQDMVFMKAAVNLAAGSNDTLAHSTSALASILQNFGLKITDSAKASNILFDASRGLHMSLSETADTMEKLRGTLGAAGLNLTDTATLMEVMVSHALTGQRQINQFTSAIDTMLGKAADPSKVVAAQNAVAKATEAVTAAQQKYNDALGKSGVSSSTHIMDLQKLQDAESKYQYTLSKYGANTVQTQSALVAVETAQQRVNNEATKGSSAVTAASNTLSKANQKLADEQAKLSLVSGSNNAELKLLGVTIYDASGNFVGMRSTIDQLHNAFIRLHYTTEQQTYALGQLFGPGKPAQIMQGIIQGGAQAWDKYAANIGNANSAQKGALAATDNLAASVERFKNRITAAATEISIKLEPVLQSLIGSATNAIGPAVGIFEFFFGVAYNAISGVVNFLVSVQHVIPLLQIVVGLFALWALRWTVIKGLNMAAEVSNLTAALVKLVVGGPLVALKNLLGFGERNTLSGALTNVKSQWGDAFQAGNLSKVTGYAKEVEKATMQVAGLNSQIEGLANLKSFGYDTSALESSLTKSFDAAQGRLAQSVNSLFANSKAGELLAGDLEKGITIARASPELQNILGDAKVASQMQNALQKGVEDSIPAVSKILDQYGNPISKAVKEGFTTGVQEAKIGEIVTKDIASNAGKAGGILSTLFGGKIGGALRFGSSAALIAQAQPVYVVNWPSGSLGGGLNPLGKGSGPSPSTDKNILQDAVKTGEQEALAADATSSTTTSSISSKIVGGIKTIAGPAIAVAAAARNVIAGAATAAGTAASGTAATVAGTVSAAASTAGPLVVSVLGTPAVIAAAGAIVPIILRNIQTSLTPSIFMPPGQPTNQALPTYRPPTASGGIINPPASLLPTAIPSGYPSTPVTAMGGGLSAPPNSAFQTSGMGALTLSPQEQGIAGQIPQFQNVIQNLISNKIIQTQSQLDQFISDMTKNFSDFTGISKQLPGVIDMVHKGLLTSQGGIDQFLTSIVSLPGGSAEIQSALGAMFDLISQGKITTQAQVLAFTSNWDKAIRVGGDIPTAEQLIIPLLGQQQTAVAGAVITSQAITNTLQRRLDRETSFEATHVNTIGSMLVDQQNEAAAERNAASSLRNSRDIYVNSYQGMSNDARVVREATSELASTTQQQVNTGKAALSLLQQQNINISQQSGLWQKILNGLSTSGDTIWNIVASEEALSVNLVQYMNQYYKDMDTIISNINAAVPRTALAPGSGKGYTGGASGLGSVVPRQTYIVGEEGWEIFKPASPTTVPTLIGAQGWELFQPQVAGAVIPHNLAVGMLADLGNVQENNPLISRTIPIDPEMGMSLLTTSSVLGLAGGTIGFDTPKEPSISGATFRGMSGLIPTTGASEGTRQGPVIEHLEVHNPIPEMASESVDRRLRRLSYSGFTSQPHPSVP